MIVLGVVFVFFMMVFIFNVSRDMKKFRLKKRREEMFHHCTRTDMSKRYSVVFFLLRYFSIIMAIVSLKAKVSAMLQGQREGELIAKKNREIEQRTGENANADWKRKYRGKHWIPTNGNSKILKERLKIEKKCHFSFNFHLFLSRNLIIAFSLICFLFIFSFAVHWSCLGLFIHTFHCTVSSYPSSPSNNFLSIPNPSLLFFPLYPRVSFYHI